MKRSKLFLLAAIAVFFAITANSYSQWTFVGAVTGAGTFPSISVCDQNVMWCAGGPNGSPKVFKSTNGGVAWTDASGNLTGNELYCLWGVDVNTCYAGDGGAVGGAGGNAKVWKTTNGGTTWTTILTTGGAAGFINGICFSRTTPLVGFIESDPPTGTGGIYWVQKTTDGGATWTLQSPPGITGCASSQNSLVCIDANYYGYMTSAASGSSRYIFTTNGGTSWVNTVMSVTGPFGSAAMVATDKVNGIFSTSASLPAMSRSVNGGTSFTSVNGAAGVTGTATGKWVYGTQYCYMMGATGAAGVAEESTNGGATWTQQTTASITGVTHMELVYVAGTIYAYAVCADGSILKLQKSPTGINPINSGIPTSFNMSQNYPNPFNPSTNVDFSLPKNSYVSIKMYDMLGHEVKTVVDGYRVAGNYSETIDASNLASGVYFYSIKTDGFTATKKMSLIK